FVAPVEQAAAHRDLAATVAPEILDAHGVRQVVERAVLEAEERLAVVLGEERLDRADALPLEAHVLEGAPVEGVALHQPDGRRAAADHEVAEVAEVAVDQETVRVAEDD